jgi:hypothetical protein
MIHALSDIERVILRVKEAEERIAEQRSRIAQLKERGRPIEMSERLLQTLETSLGLMKAHLGRLTAPPKGYRCYLMTGETIRGVQMFECPDDAEVIIKAAALLESKPEFQNAEVWEGKRLVGRIPRCPTSRQATAPH